MASTVINKLSNREMAIIINLLTAENNPEIQEATTEQLHIHYGISLWFIFLKI